MESTSLVKSGRFRFHEARLTGLARTCDTREREAQPWSRSEGGRKRFRRTKQLSVLVPLSKFHLSCDEERRMSPERRSSLPVLRMKCPCSTITARDREDGWRGDGKRGHFPTRDDGAISDRQTNNRAHYECNLINLIGGHY